MSSDLRVFIEHRIASEWVLVDLDPLHCADRNPARLNALREVHRTELPEDLSKGVTWWLSNGVNFIAAFPPSAAASIWHATERQPHLLEIDATDMTRLLLNHFGFWEIDPAAWRVVAGVSA